ncbi:hypothetical protein [Thiospirillum jenense]|nr:hypothetical protein [Thiospirillum jenense]
MFNTAPGVLFGTARVELFARLCRMAALLERHIEFLPLNHQ